VTRAGRLGRRSVATAAALLVAIACAGCAGARAERPGPASRPALHPPLAAEAGAIARYVSPKCDPTASLRPAGPAAVTPGSFMAKIRARGYLIAGVDQSTYHFGYRDPFDGQLEGFDIDMARAITTAIFGNPDRVRFVVVPDAQRIPAVESGAVDIVAHTMTMTCARWQQVDFSTVYFTAEQRVLVLRNSPYGNLADVLLYLGKVCATTSSTSLAKIRSTAYQLVGIGSGSLSVPVTDWTDCLVLLQEGAVSAISTDNSILAGLAAQDPYTKIVGPSVSAEPYGLAISSQHPDFVRFVNAVLAQMRSDGQWAALYKRWIGSPVPPPPPARYQG
jgi:polar amino acid transport system substrate-binding protein